MTVVLGIDIGLTGAVARIGGNHPTRIVDLPSVTDGPVRDRNGKPYQPMRLCGRSLLALLRELVPAGDAALVVMEDIRPRPNPTRGTSIVTEGMLMRSRGVVEAAVEIARFDLRAVIPQTWQKLYGITGDFTHDEILGIARSLYPGMCHELKRKKDHNRADALLIAHWGQKRLL